MGSLSAMSSIERVLEKHGDEIRSDLLAELKEASKGLIVDVALGNNMYEISVEAVLANGGRLDMQPIDINDLEERFPDCEVGY